MSHELPRITWKYPAGAALLAKFPVSDKTESEVMVSDPQHIRLPPGAMGMDLTSLL